MILLEHQNFEALFSVAEVATAFENEPNTLTLFFKKLLQIQSSSAVQLKQSQCVSLVFREETD